MFTMYKYQFEFANEVKIEMPEGATNISVQLQDDVPTLWAMVDPDNEPKVFKLACYWTGQPIEDANKLRFITTLQVSEKLVWHIFEKYE